MPLTANGCIDVSKKKSNKLSFDQKQEGPLYSMCFEIRKSFVMIQEAHIISRLQYWTGLMNC